MQIEEPPDVPYEIYDITFGSHDTIWSYRYHATRTEVKDQTVVVMIGKYGNVEYAASRERTFVDDPNLALPAEGPE
jgi:hypothetical protein